MKFDKRFKSYAEKKAELSEILGHQFNDDNIIIAALTHKSLATPDNSERLEFLGDRVLALFITEMLMSIYPEDAEGNLAKRLSQLARRSALAEVAETIALAKFIFIGGKADMRHQQKIIADATEAVIGALYMDGGADKARRFIVKHWRARAEAMTEVPTDAKSALQEWALKRSAELPVYELVEQVGPSHDPHFVIKVSVQELGTATGQGKNRKGAEEAAAAKLYGNIKPNEV